MEDKKYRYYRATFDDFDFDFCISFKKGTSPNKKKRKICKAIKVRLKCVHYHRVRDRYGEDYMLNKYDLDPNQPDSIDKVWTVDKPKYHLNDLVKLPECEGCRLEAPGQRDHMEPGGCLYQE